MNYYFKKITAYERLPIIMLALEFIIFIITLLIFIFMFC